VSEYELLILKSADNVAFLSFVLVAKAML